MIACRGYTPTRRTEGPPQPPGSGRRDPTPRSPTGTTVHPELIKDKLIENPITGFVGVVHDLISSLQFGFTSGKSTDDAILEVTSFISTNLDQGNKCVGIFLDLAKAFDTVSIPSLLCKLEHIGIRGLQLQLFREYLSNRTRCVGIGGNVSGFLEIEYGVPQGSVLSPILFLIYINDLLGLHLSQGKLICYADDTALLFSANTWNKVFDVAQRGFNDVCDRLRQNTLTLNPEKTQYITFTMRSSGLPFDEFNLKIHSCDNPHTQPCTCVTLRKAVSVRYLGLLIDYSLSFREHIMLLTNRVRKLIYVFKSLRHVADFDLLRKVYLSLCQSVLTYGITAWGGAAKTTH
ncbi:hypothetical protein evm_012599 [Chilo suppressalis]|nr:hypothetical protein evm_012599 [Chilo suppressalis]